MLNLRTLYLRFREGNIEGNEKVYKKEGKVIVFLNREILGKKGFRRLEEDGFLFLLRGIGLNKKVT